MSGDSFTQNNSDNSTGVQGSGNTVEVNHNYGDSDPWQPVREAVQTDVPEDQQDEGMKHVLMLETMADAEGELTDEDRNAFKEGLGWLQIQAPNALRIAAEAIRKGPRGGIAELLDIVAEYAES